MTTIRLLHSSGPQGPGGLSLLGLLLTPIAAAAAALAVWRFGADAGWTRNFFIRGGILSHWQLWGALAISLEICASRMSRGLIERVAIPPFARVQAAK